MYQINLVEDEKDLANIIEKYLTKEGYFVRKYSKGEDALKDINQKVDLWILDIMLEGEISGYDLLKEIRDQDILKPVIFTSARDQDIDKIMGLELGGDDYLAKPYSPRELVLRVKSILKRTYKEINELIIYEPYQIDLKQRKVFLNKKLIELTSKEFDLLSLFIENIGVSFPRNEILTKIWDDNYFGSDRVVDDLLRRLRNKLPEIRIETIYGYGYRLNK